MSALAEILERRARLVAEAEAQRRELADGLAGCREALVVVDRSFAWANLALAWSARLYTLWRVGRFLYSVIKPAAV
jgi:hypothetical protein